MQTGHVPWSIGVRFPESVAQVMNNLTNRPILMRDGGSATRRGNVETAAADWFVDAAAGDLHLSPLAALAFGAGVLLPDAPLDFDRQPRPVNEAPDAGAHQSAAGQRREDASRGGRPERVPGRP
jgi:hypothetical protein